MLPSRLTLAVLLACAASATAFAAPAGTVLFAQAGTVIVDASGLERPAHRGDAVQAGERVVTPANGISQLSLPDGSLLGVRPGSELKFESLAQPNGSQRQSVDLVRGVLRVIGSELMDANRLSDMHLRSGNTVLQMHAADLETAVVGAGASPAAQAGSYTYLQTGTASLSTSHAVTALEPRQISYVSPAALAPVTLSGMSVALFSSGLPAVGNVSSLSTASNVSPTLVSSTPTAPLPASTLTNTLPTALGASVPTTPFTAAPLVLAPVVVPTVLFVAPPRLAIVNVPPPVAYVPPSLTAVTGSTVTKTLSTTTLTCRLARC